MAELKHRAERSPEFRVRGMSVAITRSQQQNALICQKFWRTFNAELAASRLTQENDWRKFAITYPHEGTHRYFCGIPDDPTRAMPDLFGTFTVPAADYLVFHHEGSMAGLGSTLSAIYRQILPQLDVAPTHESLFHFEKYDQRFHWNRADSVIEIWVPIVR